MLALRVLRAGRAGRAVRRACCPRPPPAPGPAPRRAILSQSTTLTPFTESEEHTVEASLGEYNVRQTLHQNSVDPLITRINAAASVEELFSLLDSEYEQLGPEHLSQCVLVLWDLQKIYNEAYLLNLGKEDIDASPEHMLDGYLNRLKEHKDFARLLRLVEVHCTELTASEATCCLLYLKKMGVSLWGTPVMAQLLSRCTEALEAGDMKNSLLDLMRLTAALNAKNNYQYICIVSRMLPDALDFIDRCNSAEDLRLLTFLLYNVQTVLTGPSIIRYKQRLRHLIQAKVLDSTHYAVLVKAASFLNIPQWSKENLSHIREICELVQPEIHNMDPGSIVTLHKVFQTQLEPAQIVEPIRKRSAQLISSMLHDDRISPHLKLPHLLFCQVTHSAPERRVAFEKLTSEYMSKLFPSTVIAFYKILKYLRTPNTQLCDMLWGKTLGLLMSKENDENLVLLISHKYLYFSNIGNLYRNLYLERFMLNTLLQMMNDDYVTIFPRKLSRLCAFVIAYGYSNHSIHVNDLKKIVTRIEDMTDQFDSLDCLLLSRGLQISSVCMAKKMTSPILAQLLLRIDNVLTERTQRLSENKNLSLIDLNCLVKSHINKKTNPESDVTYELIKKYRDVERDYLNSQSVRDIVFNFNTIGVIIPSVFESLSEYIVEQKGRILGETALRIIHMFYNLGYGPQEREVLRVSSDVIERDKLVMNSLTLLQACTALAYYQHLPHSLMQYIFSIEFMERLDAEIATCYQKWLYPGRVRQQLMALNRCVCLESPQHRVPWFHEKYLQEQRAMTPVRSSLFESNVLQTLRSVAPRALVKAQHHSPYGYRVNFLVQLDEDGNLDTPETVNAAHDKIAIQLLDGSSYCKLLNEDPTSKNTGEYKTVLRGSAKHRRRHLEILGYKLVEISAALWNSMHMTEPNVKADYLRQRIWGDGECDSS